MKYIFPCDHYSKSEYFHLGLVDFFLKIPIHDLKNYNLIKQTKNDT
jgi:hypothetical protein